MKPASICLSQQAIIVLTGAYLVFQIHVSTAKLVSFWSSPINIDIVKRPQICGTIMYLVRTGPPTPPLLAPSSREAIARARSSNICRLTRLLSLTVLVNVAFRRSCT